MTLNAEPPLASNCASRMTRTQRGLLPVEEGIHEDPLPLERIGGAARPCTRESAHMAESLRAMSNIRTRILPWAARCVTLGRGRMITMRAATPGTSSRAATRESGRCTMLRVLSALTSALARARPPGCNSRALGAVLPGRRAPRVDRPGASLARSATEIHSLFTHCTISSPPPI